MDVEEIKKLTRNKIEAEALTKQVRDRIKTTIREKQNRREGFKETFKPFIESQDSVKKEQQNATIKQLQANQLARTQGLNQNRLAITEGRDKLDDVKKWDLAQLRGFEATEGPKEDEDDDEYEDAEGEEEKFTYDPQIGFNKEDIDFLKDNNYPLPRYLYKEKFDRNKLSEKDKIEFDKTLSNYKTTHKNECR